jgi:hypothetical protein
VRLFDVKAPAGGYAPLPSASEPWLGSEQYEPCVPPGAELVLGDITLFHEVEKALRGASVVFHIASYGMSGAEALKSGLIYEVNVREMKREEARKGSRG